MRLGQLAPLLPPADTDPTGCAGNSFEFLGLDNSTLHSDHRCVGANHSHPTWRGCFDSFLDGFFDNREVRRDVFVGIPGCNQPEDFRAGVRTLSVVWSVPLSEHGRLGSSSAIPCTTDSSAGTPGHRPAWRAQPAHPRNRWS